MPPSRYKGRRIEVCLKSEKIKKKWEKAAENADSLASFIFETVEAAIDGSANRPDDRSPALREENRKLKRELASLYARNSQLETEVFKLRNASFLAPPDGIQEPSPALVQALRSGGTWNTRGLLQELAVNPEDITAIKILSGQLQALQDFGLVSENVRGWRWVER